MSKRYSKNVQLVLDILQDEVKGDSASALLKMSPKYTMTWVYEGRKKKLFPRARVSGKKDLADAYVITGRKYEIFTITENKNTVMVELIESYPDPQTKKIYRTPLVLVLEIEKGQIVTGRHYCDPNISYRFLTKEVAGKIFPQLRKPRVVIQ